jgi:hypothetical protein
MSGKTTESFKSRSYIKQQLFLTPSSTNIDVIVCINEDIFFRQFKHTGYVLHYVSYIRIMFRPQGPSSGVTIKINREN